jgi:hypothetical protein
MGAQPDYLGQLDLESLLDDAQSLAMYLDDSPVVESGGMGSVGLRFNPYTHLWVAYASYSNCKAIVSNECESAADAVLELQDLLSAARKTQMAILSNTPK